MDIEVYNNLNPNLKALVILLIINACFHVGIKLKHRFFIYLYFTSLVGVFFIFHSRTFLFAGFASSLYFNRVANSSKRWSTFLILVLFLFLSVFAGKSKIQSNFGRFFILKLHADFLSFGNQEYTKQAVNHFQIQEFKKGKYSEFAMNANSNEHVLNDFFELTIRYKYAGFIVSVLLFFGFLFFFRKYYLNRTLNLFLLLLLPFHVFAIFNCPLQIKFTGFIYIAIYFCFIATVLVSNFFLQKLVQISVLAFLFSFVIVEQHQLNIIHQMHTAFKLGYFSESSNRYNKLNMRYQLSEILFKADLLNQQNSVDSAIALLSNNHNSSCSYNYHLQLAKYYTELKKDSLAIENLIYAQYLVPHKFEPLYHLMNIYKVAKNTKLAEFYADAILKKRVKIYNQQYYFYLNEAKKVLEKRFVYL